MKQLVHRSASPTLIVGAFFLLTSCAGESKPAASADSAAPIAVATESSAEKGKTTYGQICASCHLATGVGQEGNFPPLVNSPWLNGDPSVPISIVIAGLQGEIKVEGKTYNGVMQPWGMLSDDDVANVLTYARSEWGNSGAPVTAEQVKAVREKMGNRGAWTAEELQKTYPGAGR